MQNVQTVEKSVRYHSDPKRTDQFIAMNAFRITNRHDAVTGMKDLEVLEESIERGKCLMQNVQTVEKSVRYHSDPKRTDQFIAMNAFRITGITKLFKVLDTLKHIKIQSGIK